MNSVLDEYQFQIYQLYQKCFVIPISIVWKYDLSKIYKFAYNIFQYCEY
jgi:hypothetical protein